MTAVNIIEKKQDFTAEFSEGSWIQQASATLLIDAPDRAYRIFASNHEEMTTKSEYDKTA